MPQKNVFMWPNMDLSSARSEDKLLSESACKRLRILEFDGQSWVTSGVIVSTSVRALLKACSALRLRRSYSAVCPSSTNDFNSLHASLPLLDISGFWAERTIRGYVGKRFSRRNIQGVQVIQSSPYPLKICQAPFLQKHLILSPHWKKKVSQISFFSPKQKSSPAFCEFIVKISQTEIKIKTTNIQVNK